MRTILLTQVLVLITSCVNVTDESIITGRVTDKAGVLTEREAELFTSILAEHESTTCHQFAILIIKSTKPESISDYSLRVAKDFGFGYEAHDNGLLIVLATEDQRIRVEVGLGLEYYIDDDAARKVIHEAIIPSLKNEETFEGLQSGLMELMHMSKAYRIPETERPRVCQNA